MKQTLDELDAVGIGHSGTARSRGEAQTPSIYTVNGIRIAHLAYTYGYNGYTVPSGPAVVLQYDLGTADGR